jgi:hypothetical protein
MWCQDAEAATALCRYPMYQKRISYFINMTAVDNCVDSAVARRATTLPVQSDRFQYIILKINNLSEFLRA